MWAVLVRILPARSGLKAKLPFDGMRRAASSAEPQFFAALLKEIPAAVFACLRRGTHTQAQFSKP